MCHDKIFNYLVLVIKLNYNEMSMKIGGTK